VTSGGGGTQRLLGLDALKALAILAVVAIHAAPVEPSAYQRHAVGGVFRLAVPLFLVVTGFLAGVKETGPSRMAAYFRRFLFLHLFYAAFYWALESVRAGRLEWPGAKAVLLHFGEAAWPGQFYFVILIQLFFLAAFVLPPGFWRNRAWLAAAAAAAAAGIAALPFARELPDAGLLGLVRRVAGSGSGIWLWLWYFALGGCLGDRARQGRLPALLADRTAAAGLLGLAVLLAALDWPRSGDVLLDPYARASIVTGATLAGLAVPALAGAVPPGLIRRLGAASFGVFVLNPALLFPLQGVFGVARDAWTSWLMVTAVVVVAVPLTEWLRARWPRLVP
jgi:surface polysaccharide O-acyltransferase-like enzyme